MASSSEFEEKNLSKNETKKEILINLHRGSFWDPSNSHDWDQAGPPGILAANRIKRDISNLFTEPLPGIFIVPDDKNLCLVHCLIIGPFDTPYEGGFFKFIVRFGPSYPLHPPRVKFLTTHNGKVRFNPNLYKDGKVCLSILGTWCGPAWSPASNLGSLLLSIQSLLNEKPYFNEPGFQKEMYSGESDRYNEYITHETIRVAVCSQMESILSGVDKSTPEELVYVAKSTFLDFYSYYIDKCNEKLTLDGTEMKDMFSTVSKFNYSSLLSRLKEIKEKLENDRAVESGPKTTDSEISCSSDSDSNSTPATKNI